MEWGMLANSSWVHELQLLTGGEKLVSIILKFYSKECLAFQLQGYEALGLLSSTEQVTSVKLAGSP